MSRLLVKSIFTFCLALMVSGGAFAQTAGQYIAKGNKEQKDGYFQSAIFYYKKALKMDTNLLEANFETAQAYRKLRNYKRALSFYEATVSVDGRDLFPEARFYSGLMQKQMGKYKDAKRNFESFLSIYRSRDDMYRWARDEVISCDWALEHKNDTAEYEILKPDSGMNTIHAEMSPYLYDSNTLYLSTMRYEKDEVKKNNPVFVEVQKMVHDSGIWIIAELDLPIAAEDAHVGNGVFSADSSRFYFSKCPDFGSCSIYVTKNKGGTWNEPSPLPEPVNVANATNTQPTIAKIGEDEFLIFASNRSTGKGGMDLWFVPLKNGEPTSRLRNMGNNVNTKGDEITPYFDRSDTTTYFSSNRHPGFGGFDVFKSQGKPGSFNATENLGTEVNSPADDYYLMMKRQDSVGYFASNRISGLKKSGNETCCNDLYKIRVLPPPVEILPIDTLEVDTLEADSLPPAALVEIENPKNLKELQTLLPISLYFHNDRPNPRTTSKTTKLTYVETVEEYVGLRQEYIDAVNNSALDGTAKIELGDALKLLFERDLQASISRLNKALDVLLIELADSATINLAVKGYASPLADSDYNLNLTFRRIASMENYINQYANSVFKPYLKSGQMTIEKIPYGESQASASVSDSKDKALESIYGINAIRERRIEILRIEEQ
ncbi:CDC27 family protein [Salibacteraceae bacterium]|nr:CDC27 family protein [Salibacteraceae bacterium]